MKRTPCGLPVAVKRNRPKECDILKALAASSSGKLFPMYYYYSNTTFGCYSEMIGSASLMDWLWLIPVQFGPHEMTPDRLRVLKTVFLQGVTAVHKCVIVCIATHCLRISACRKIVVRRSVALKLPSCVCVGVSCTFHPHCTWIYECACVCICSCQLLV